MHVGLSVWQRRAILKVRKSASCPRAGMYRWGGRRVKAGQHTGNQAILAVLAVAILNVRQAAQCPKAGHVQVGGRRVKPGQHCGWSEAQISAHQAMEFCRTSQCS